MSSSTSVVRPRAAFILGIAHRSGTNFLCDLLVQHPSCQRVQRIWEDYLLARSHLLRGFASSVAGCWNERWDPEGAAARELETLLTSACLDFLASLAQDAKGGRLLVTKTPSVENLQLLPMFRQAKAVVLVRDGRSVVESSMRSFGWDFEAVAREWARAAAIIIAARERGTDFLLVRYEDLLGRLEEEVRRVFGFLGVEPSKYDFESARELPVRGSSDLGKEQSGLHWRPSEKAADFCPRERWRDWRSADHDRFNSIAGEYLGKFGYDTRVG